LEVLCKQLYESSSAEARSEAEKALVTFQNSADSLAPCRQLLERADTPYAQLLATTTLTKLAGKTNNTQALTLEQRVEIRNYALTYLYGRPKLAAYVVQGERGFD